MRHTAIILCIALLTASCQQTVWHKDRGFVFGTCYTITYFSSRALQEEIEERLARIDRSLSLFNPHSTLSRINGNIPLSADPFAPDSSLSAKTLEFDLSRDSLALEVLRKGWEISAKTRGAFDMTVGVLAKHWGFGTQDDTDISRKLIDSIRQFTGYRRIGIDSSGLLVKSDPRISLDANAIAKGYACDYVAGFFKSRGIRNFLIEIGGEIVACGHNPQNKKWTIGIQNPCPGPAEDSSALSAVITINDAALATSGNYRNYRILNGKKYGHILDPVSGRSIQSDLSSASVLAPDCLTADAYATAFMVMGLQRSLQLQKDSLPQIRYYLIDTTGRVSQNLFAGE